MSVHRLKTHTTWFSRVADGHKTAELRRHDRDFQAGDTLHLVETWAEEGRHYDEEEKVVVWHKKDQETGRELFAEVTHVLPSTQYPDGLRDGYCLLSFKRGGAS